MPTGGTARLDGVGKVLIMAGMFAGRVGPVTLFVLLAQRDDGGPRWTRPERELPVG